MKTEWEKMWEEVSESVANNEPLSSKDEALKNLADLIHTSRIHRLPMCKWFLLKLKKKV
jgi:hypothetical protein